MRQAMLAMAAMAAVAVAADDKPGKAGGDQDFVHKASASDLAEINTSTLAVKNASSEAVKKFAQKMIEDHTKTSKELLALANKKMYKPAERMDEKHQKMAEKLASLKGDAFDREYIHGQVKAHEEAVALFTKQAEGGSDEDLKAWAKKTLPHLKHHLKMAQDLHKAEGGKDAPSKGTGR